MNGDMAGARPRITVSTVGLIAGIKEFLEKSRCHLAVSLHSPFDEERRKLMPVQRTNTVEEVLDIIRKFDFNSQRRVSFEYILFKGLNDTPRHIKELARILNGIKCRINIIRFHPIPGSQFQSPDLEATIAFKEALNAKGITNYNQGQQRCRYSGCMRFIIYYRTKQTCLAMVRTFLVIYFLFINSVLILPGKVI